VAGNQQLLIAAQLVQVTAIGATGTTPRSLVPDVATLAWPDRQVLGALPQPWTGRTHRSLSRTTKVRGTSQGETPHRRLRQPT
jgi:hypothetical protein